MANVENDFVEVSKNLIDADPKIIFIWTIQIIMYP